MKNAGYEIVKEEMYSDEYGVALGYNPKATISPWVTWEYEPKRNSYFWGHYFSQLTDALIDYHTRILKRLEKKK